MNLRLFAAIWLSVGAALAGFAQQAPEHDHAHSETGRVPANILPAERAGILLLEQRDALEQPETTLDLMQLEDGDLVADLGCGNGYYTLRLAERIAPHGHVFAVDIQQGMLDQLEARMDEAGVRNVYPILGAYDDPYLPRGKIDWLMLVDVYHEFSDPEAMLAKIRECLAPEGRVALLEYRAEQDPATIGFPIPRDHKMTVDEVLSEWIPAGFRLSAQIEVLPAQHIFFFEAADDAEPAEIRPIQMSGTANVSTYGNDVFFAAQPTEDDLETFAALGVKTVLNLRTPEEMESVAFNEAEKAAELGMNYVNVPMGREIPSETDLNTIFDTIEASESTSVLVHCASSNRVGTVWALYRALREDLGTEAAVEEGRAAGMRSEAFVERVKELTAK